MIIITRKVQWTIILCCFVTLPRVDAVTIHIPPGQSMITTQGSDVTFDLTGWYCVNNGHHLILDPTPTEAARELIRMFRTAEALIVRPQDPKQPPYYVGGNNQSLIQLSVWPLIHLGNAATGSTGNEPTLVTLRAAAATIARISPKQLFRIDFAQRNFVKDHKSSGGWGWVNIKAQLFQTQRRILTGCYTEEDIQELYAAVVTAAEAFTTAAQDAVELVDK